MCMPTGKEKCLEPFKSSTFFKTNLTVYYGLSWMDWGAGGYGVGNYVLASWKKCSADVKVNPTNLFLFTTNNFLLLLYSHLINFHTFFEDGRGHEQNTPERKPAGEDVWGGDVPAPVSCIAAFKALYRMQMYPMYYTITIHQSLNSNTFMIFLFLLRHYCKF